LNGQAIGINHRLSLARHAALDLPSDCLPCSGGAGRVFGNDLVDAAGEWKLVQARTPDQYPGNPLIL
jgi:hypothetical protein